MTSYRPASFPRRPKNSNVATEIRYFLAKIYYQYEVNTVQYLMSPGEKLVYNLIAASFMMLLLWAIYYYLPKTTAMALQRVMYYYTGQHKHQLGGVVQDAGDATAGLLDSSLVLNATAFNTF